MIHLLNVQLGGASIAAPLVVGASGTDFAVRLGLGLIALCVRRGACAGDIRGVRYRPKD